MTDAVGDRRPPAKLSERSRAEHVIATLARHGIRLLDDAVVHHSADDQVRAVQLREALEELGTVFIKLGQFIESQAVALPKAYRDELAKLDDNVPPVPSAAIRSIVTTQLGEDVETLFASFSDHALGSASIGQVHAATLLDGRDVVVKVKKPGVDALVATDLALLKHWVSRLSPHVASLRELHAPELIPEFTKVMEAELDYAAEVANVNFFEHFYHADAGIEVPQVIGDRTAGDVICETRLTGSAVLKAPPATMPADTPTKLADNIVRLVLEPGLTAGTFHADPHAGNLLLAEDGRLGVIDFGKVGRLTTADRQHLIAMLLAIGSRDPDRLTDALLNLADIDHPVDRRSLAEDVEQLLMQYADAAVGGIDVQAGVNDLLALVTRYGLSFPGRIVLFFKALAMSEGLVTAIDPRIRFDRVLGPVLRRILIERITHGESAARLASWALETGDALAELPAHAGRAFAAAADGQLHLSATVEDLPAVVSKLGGMVDRLTAAVLVAASIIGTAVVLEAYRPSLPTGIGGLPWLLAGIALTFVVRAISRHLHRRRRRTRS